MYKKIMGKFLIATVLTIVATKSYAVGLGFSAGTGWEKWEEDEDDPAHEEDRRVSNFGFVLDTAVARDKIFNYRVSFMIEKNNADGGGDVDMRGISMTHDFGIAVYRSQLVRVWVGPELKAMSYSSLSSSSSGENIDGDAYGFGVGPVAGVNLHLPNTVSFSFTTAYYIASRYSADFTTENRYQDFGMNSNGLHWKASIIFRINE